MKREMLAVRGMRDENVNVRFIYSSLNKPELCQNDGEQRLENNTL